MPEPANNAVFLSYARQDTEPASRIAEALRALGVEAWFDQNELDGGDAWDAKIRRQIKECGLFVPIISANTQERTEGYFRFEWHLAEQRSLLMARGRPFILPVSVDATTDQGALVPDAFLSVQWMRCTDAQSTEALAHHVRRLLQGGGKVIGGGPTELAAAPRVDPKSVAVLAFTSSSHDPESESFSEGISEELLNVLARVPGLQVAARTSSFYFKGRQTPLAEIAQKLGVAYIVEGSVRRAGARARISAQLVNTADGFPVWADSFDRDLKDVFAVQDEIAGLVAEKLQLRLAGSARATRIINPEAHRLTLYARHLWHVHIGTDEGFAKAEAALNQAIQIDPLFAEAHAGIAEVCVNRANYRHWRGVADIGGDLQRALSEAQIAIRLDPTQAEPYAAAGFVQLVLGRLAEAEPHFTKSIEINPNAAVARCWYALLQGVQGRLDEGIANLKKSCELDPLRFASQQIYVRSLINARQFEEALRVNTLAAHLRTDIPLLNYADQAQILSGLGRHEEAAAAARYIVQNPTAGPRWQADGDAVWVLRQAGHVDEARAYADLLFSRWPTGLFLRGFVLGALGRYDEALPFLEHTPVISSVWLHWNLMWDPIRDDPRFEQVMAKLGRSNEYRVARATLARMMAGGTKAASPSG